MMAQTQCNIVKKYEVKPNGCFREESEKGEIHSYSRNFITNVRGPPIPRKYMIRHCTIMWL